MKIVCISDTHNQHQHTKLPEDAEVLIHAGDCTGRGHKNELISFLWWFAGQAAPIKILIAGNHDWIFEREPVKARDLIRKYAPNIIYLENSGVRLPNGLYVWGSPCTPEFFNWAFNVPRNGLGEVWKKIPANTDIVITHGPPQDILDTTSLGIHRIGCSFLAQRIHQIKPTLHVFGHNHAGYGTVEADGTIYVNAAQLNDNYDYVNEPVIITI